MGTSKDTSPMAVAVFCGAQSGSTSIFAESAQALASALNTEGWSMVYGGGTVGMMGKIAQTLVQLSGPQSVHGIIPKVLVSVERKRNPATESEAEREKAYGRLTIVKDMHERKRTMAAAADAFVALPGGFGTMEEVMEIITWNFIGIHLKPIVLFNVDGYYDDIFSWIKKAIRNGFVNERNSNIVVQARNAEEVIAAIKNYRVVEGRHDLKWNTNHQGAIEKVT